MLTSEQVRAARSMLRIDQKALAERSGVSLETIKRIERTPGEVSAYASTVDAIRRALEAEGIEFLDDGDGVKRRPGAKPTMALSKPAAGKAAGKPAGGMPHRPGSKRESK